MLPTMKTNTYSNKLIFHLLTKLLAFRGLQKVFTMHETKGEYPELLTSACTFYSLPLSSLIDGMLGSEALR